MNPPTTETKKINFWEVMRANGVVLSMTTSEGYANVKMNKSYNDREEMVVTFFDEEGVSQEDLEIPAEDLIKLGKFIADLNALRLEDFKKEI